MSSPQEQTAETVTMEDAQSQTLPATQDSYYEPISDSEDCQNSPKTQEIENGEMERVITTSSSDNEQKLTCEADSCDIDQNIPPSDDVQNEDKVQANGETLSEGKPRVTYRGAKLYRKQPKYMVKAKRAGLKLTITTSKRKPDSQVSSTTIDEESV